MGRFLPPIIQSHYFRTHVTLIMARFDVEYPTVADAVIEAAKKLSKFPRQKYF